MGSFFNRSGIRRVTALFMCAVFSVAFLMPVTAHNEKKAKTVRVGWYESSFNNTDKSGRRSGYAYEYQMKIAAYTGWKYEYVNGSWSELMDMLRKGKIDLMSDVSYTDERAEEMLFPSLPMGTEEYYIFSSPGNQVISPDDYSTLNGKRIGVNKGSVQVGMYNEWAARNDVHAELVELTTHEDESLKMLEKGDLDAYITPDAFADPEHLTPVVKIGSSDYFFAVSKERTDLIEDLNRAMNSIQDENRFYNQMMSEKYLISAGSNSYLTSGEKSWLAVHGPIKVGYQDDYLAFCAEDDEGELTGALKDYLEYISGDLENAELEFETRAYPTSQEALEAMKNGEIDCMFPANLSGYDGETMSVSMTHPVMKSSIYAIVRKTDQNVFADRKHVVVAVDNGNPNYNTFLLDNFPQWRTVYYENSKECLKAVSKGVADCLLISSFRYSNLERLCEEYGLTTVDTGTGLDYCFAVADDKPELYAILTKAIGRVPDSVVSAAVAHYVSEEAKTTLTDMIRDNLETVIFATLLFLAVIFTLMIRSMRAEKRANELIARTEIDDLTGLYNRDYFFEYANRMKREKPDVSMDAMVINIEQFHSVNALNGRKFGDQVLRVLGREIQAIAKENGGIGGRFGADRFDIYCRHTDDHQAIFDRLQEKMNELMPNEGIRIRMGVMQSQPDIEPVQMFDMARTACSMARGHYKERLIVFNDEVRKREMYEQLLISDLSRALDGFEFEVFYQPKYDIQTQPPELVSAEALVRWNHPELGLIPPDDFIPLFERSGKISEIDKYVWSEAARQIVRWREIYGRTIPVSVNLSRVDVFDPDLEKNLDDILRYNGLGPEVIKLEVTETAYTEDSEQVIKVVERLRKKGFMVEMDDFGTGYSSLNMLSAMPVDVLKMDREFVRNIEHSEKAIRLVALILNTAKELDVPVIAEGVETESQLMLLRELGCAVVQGYYFSRPLPAAEFEKKIIRKSDKKEVTD